MSPASVLFVLGSMSFILGTLTQKPAGWFAGGVFLSLASLALVVGGPADWRAWAFLAGSLAFLVGAGGYLLPLLKGA